MNYTVDDLGFCDFTEYNQVINIDKATFLRKALCNSYFPKELPPIFSTEKFGKLIENQIKANKLQGNKICEGTGYYITKNNNSQRLLSIPHPLAYSNVCRIIYENWEYVKYFIAKNWQNKSVSMIIPRNSSDLQRLVPMEYNTKTKDDILAKLEMLGTGKYIVKTDISMAFPSIYSHSITWEIKGKEIAQEQQKNKDWINDLDLAIRYMSNNESIGIPISPDISNIIFETIISYIDKELINQDFKYIRYIDDFFVFVIRKKKQKGLFWHLQKN
ncbi:MAG: RNA-directed DNA polymerase [Muribaculaceae bacterium]|nr:RNA-directed DNA polymerase [Muribaculaceae bacterium]MCM1441776.1 RNA-directed DNA polymerase [Roseburia sp.]